MTKDHPCPSCPAWSACAFHPLSSTQIETLFRGKNCLHFGKHEMIFSAHSKPLGVYCIKSGMVKLTNHGTQPGIEQILNIAKAGEVLGLDDALGDHFFHYNAETLEETDICLIEKATFIDLMADNALLSQEILKRAFASVKDRDASISRLTQYNVRERTAQTLLSLIAEHGVRTQEGIKLDLNLTRKEIGQYSGTVQESIIRVLSDFKAEGLIDLEKSEITILDANLLCRVFRSTDEPQ